MTMRTHRRQTTWNSIALVSVVLLCTCTLFYLYHQDRYHFDIARIKDGFHSFGYRPPNDGSASHSSEGVFNASLPDTSNHGVSANRTEVDLVVASTTTDNTTWITERLRDWQATIYVVDDQDALLTVPQNKGKESMVYLTYIIDNYFNLPEYVIFSHANRFQWHNDDPDYDGLAVLRRLQLPYLRSQGYVNLRCTWTLGCPVELLPFKDEGSTDEYKKTASVYKRAFQELLPGVEVPPQVGQSCCAQFAATRATIRSRDRSEYEHMRDWLIKTDLDDSTSGRIFEYAWHIIFGKEPVFCPAADQCYCKLFGLCDLECDSGTCANRYTLPQFQELPGDWPYTDWDGSMRDYVEPAWR